MREPSRSDYEVVITQSFLTQQYVVKVTLGGKEVLCPQATPLGCDSRESALECADKAITRDIKRRNYKPEVLSGDEVAAELNNNNPQGDNSATTQKDRQEESNATASPEGEVEGQ